MDDDLWRADGSFRALSGGNGGSSRGKSKGKAGGGLTFTRVIPKFLQKYHQQVPGAAATAATAATGGGMSLPSEPTLADKQPPQQTQAQAQEEEEEEELDEVQKAAIEAYHREQQQAKKTRAAAAAAATPAPPAAEAQHANKGKDNHGPQRTRKSRQGQAIAEMTHSKAKRQAADDSAKDITSTSNKRKRRNQPKAVNNKQLLSFSMEDEA